MKRVATVATLLWLGSASYTHAQMQDLSMSPSEMIQNPQVLNNKSSGQQGGNSFLNNQPKNNNFHAQAPIINPEFQAANNYMDGFCDPNFKPMLSNNPRYANMAACLQQQRQEACARYQALPPDAKSAVDSAINCANSMSNGMGEDGWGEENATAITPPQRSCGDANMPRLELVKKYWTDEYVSYALIFLPDDVMDNSGKCLGR